MRTRKTVGNTVYNYYYADGLLIRQTWGTNYMDFLYDESGTPYSFIYNGTQYYYVKNLQGDVMRIVDATGNVVANYFYDAWGKVTSSGNIVGQYNPIRYRGYYYDTETGFYYLQSRYYDPVVRRFISEDAVKYLGANGDFTSLNLYTYRENNSMIGYDPYGKATISLNFGGYFFFLAGSSYMISLVIDDNGNIALQKTKADVFRKNKGAIFGNLDAGGGLSFTLSTADTVYDLEGASFSAGVSTKLFGVDVATSDLSDIKNSVKSITITPPKASTQLSSLSIRSQVAQTETIASLNIKDALHGLWEEVKSWFK